MIAQTESTAPTPTGTANGKRRVLLIADMSWKRMGARLASTDRRLLAGLWRNGDLAYEVSDRDLVRFLGGPLKALGERRVNRALLDIAATVRPHVVLISNCHAIRPETLRRLRDVVPGVRIGNYTVDALFVPRNMAHQRARAAVVDATFATQGGPALADLGATGTPALWMPNPVDPAFDPHRNGRLGPEDLPVDLLFCGSGTPGEARWQRIGALKKALADIRFDVRGMHDVAPVEGVDYLDLLGQAKAALAMNREEHLLYSSDRLAQLLGNGVATLIDRASGYDRYFGPDEEAVFYHDLDDLAEAARRLARDDVHRRRVAEGGYRKAHRLFAAHLVAGYLVDATLDPSTTPPWERAA